MIIQLEYTKYKFDKNVSFKFLINYDGFIKIYEYQTSYLSSDNMSSDSLFLASGLSPNLLPNLYAS